MYYAQNTTDQAAALALFKSRFLETPELHWMAMIDGAFDYAVQASRPIFPAASISMQIAQARWTTWRLSRLADSVKTRRHRY